MPSPTSKPSVAVVGSGISGLATAWLLHRSGQCKSRKSRRKSQDRYFLPGAHRDSPAPARAPFFSFSPGRVTVLEKEDRCGGHTLTDTTVEPPVDLGFQPVTRFRRLPFTLRYPHRYGGACRRVPSGQARASKSHLCLHFCVCRQGLQPDHVPAPHPVF